MDHIILSCDFTFQCWHKILTKLNWVSAISRDLVNLFKCWPNMVASRFIQRNLSISYSAGSKYGCRLSFQFRV